MADHEPSTLPPAGKLHPPLAKLFNLFARSELTGELDGLVGDKSIGATQRSTTLTTMHLMSNMLDDASDESVDDNMMILEKECSFTETEAVYLKRYLAEAPLLHGLKAEDQRCLMYLCDTIAFIGNNASQLDHDGLRFLVAADRARSLQADVESGRHEHELAHMAMLRKVAEDKTTRCGLNLDAARMKFERLEEDLNTPRNRNKTFTREHSSSDLGRSGLLKESSTSDLRRSQAMVRESSNDNLCCNLVQETEAVHHAVEMLSGADIEFMSLDDIAELEESCRELSDQLGERGETVMVTEQELEHTIHAEEAMVALRKVLSSMDMALTLTLSLTLPS